MRDAVEWLHEAAADQDIDDVEALRDDIAAADAARKQLTLVAVCVLVVFLEPFSGRERF